MEFYLNDFLSTSPVPIACPSYRVQFLVFITNLLSRKSIPSLQNQRSSHGDRPAERPLQPKTMFSFSGQILVWFDVKTTNRTSDSVFFFSAGVHREDVRDPEDRGGGLTPLLLEADPANNRKWHQTLERITALTSSPPPTCFLCDPQSSATTVRRWSCEMHCGRCRTEWSGEEPAVCFGVFSFTDAPISSFLFGSFMFSLLFSSNKARD